MRRKPSHSTRRTTRPHPLARLDSTRAFLAVAFS